MVFLLSGSNFNKRNHVHSGREANLRVFVNTSDCCHSVAILNLQLLKEASQWVEAVVDIVFVCVAAYKES